MSATLASHRALQPGDRAPDFTLPAINGEGSISLADYRGRTAVFVGLFRGLQCPFCRRQLARLSTTTVKLAREGVATVAVVNTQLERARLYFKYRPMPVPLAADPEAQTQSAYGLPQFEILPESTDPARAHWPRSATMQRLMQTALSGGGELSPPLNIIEANDTLNRRDGFEMTPADEEMHARHGTLMMGQFLIDAAGIIRWSFVEAPDSPDQLGMVAGDDEIIVAARQLLR